MSQRLPIPGGDDGDWGNILNGFLSVSHANDGTLNSNVVADAQVASTADINPTKIAGTAEVQTNKGIASGYAGLDTNSLVLTGELATGTANNTTFLRGDQTWAAVAGGGSGTLSGDSDVTITSPTNGQVLTYNTGASKWENLAPAVASVFGRTGAITAQSGDYTAAQVTNALVSTNNLSDVASVSTARTNLGLGSAATQAIATFLQTANNLSDLPSASTARTNLGLGSAATQATSAFLQVANNLSDVASVSTARTNLGLGTAATQAIATFLQVSNNLSDLASASTARTNLGLGSSATQNKVAAGSTGVLDATDPTTTNSRTPTGTAGGDLTGTYPNPTVTSTANFKTQVETVRLDQMAAPTSAVALNAQKITGLANGTLSTDAAAFGQIPTGLPPNGSAGGDLTGSYPNPTLAAIGSATGPIGSATTTPVVTIDAKGRVTALTSATITGGGVTSYNTRSGAVTSTATDVESLFTAPGQMFVGTGSGTGTLLGDGTTGQVLTAVANAAPQWLSSDMGYPLTAFGAKNDAKKVIDGVITSTTTLTSATASFTSGDSGKLVAGNGIPVNTTITFVNSTTVTLSNISSNGSSLVITWGTDALTALNSAISAFGTGPGQIFVSGPNIISAAPTSMASSSGIKFIGLNGVASTLTPGSAFGALPQSCLITAQASPSYSDGVTTTSSNTLQSAAAGFTTADVGCPVNAAFLPTGTHVISVSGTTASLSQNITGSGGSGQTFTIGRPFINFFESSNCGCSTMGILSATPLFIGPLIHNCAHNSASSSGGLFLNACTIGEVAPSTGKCYGTTTTRTYSPRAVNCRFIGCLIQRLICVDGSFSNNFVDIGCTYDQYGLVALRNPSEGTLLIGSSVGINGAASDARFIDMSNGVGGPGSTIDGLFIRDTWAGDTNGVTGAWIRVGGLNSSGMVVVDGWRGTSNNTLVQLNYASGLNGLSIKNISWDGTGAILDFNSFTVTGLHIEDSVHVQGASGSMYANIPSTNQPNGIPSTISVTGSPFTYTNADNVKEVVYIDQGTLTTPYIVKGGVTIFQGSGHAVLLNPGEAVTVTYSSAPTMVKDQNRY